jgi:hypothetical protein
MANAGSGPCRALGSLAFRPRTKVRLKINVHIGPLAGSSGDGLPVHLLGSHAATRTAARSGAPLVPVAQNIFPSALLTSFCGDRSPRRSCLLPSLIPSPRFFSNQDRYCISLLGYWGFRLCLLGLYAFDSRTTGLREGSNLIACHEHSRIATFISGRALAVPRWRLFARCTDCPSNQKVSEICAA